jgi:hypothetical protein
VQGPHDSRGGSRLQGVEDRLRFPARTHRAGFPEYRKVLGKR